MNLRKRALSMLLSAAMICNMGVTPVFAYTATGDTSIGASSICEHHLEHTTECGYTEGTAGAPCTHTHTQDCYKLVCTHVHDTACGYMEKTAGMPCTYECLICNPASDKPLDSGAVSTPFDATKAVTLWQFVDPENNLTENTLALPGVNAQMQASFDDVVALLPTALTGTVEGAAEPATVNITGWVCESYKQDESSNWPIGGTFTFVATLAEGYTATPVPTVMVELGGAKLLVGETGDFTVTGGTYGTSHKYETNTLTIMDSTALTISGTTTADKIVVADGVTANVTLDGVNIDMSGTYQACAFEIAGAAACNLTLSGDNTLKGGVQRAGLQVQTKDSKTASLVIAKESTGSLNASGGSQSAGIGGSCGRTMGSGYSGGTITINGGRVTATGGGSAAGIGGGDGGTGGTTTISGGTVTATGGDHSAGIGGAGGTVTISGGTVNANGTGNNEGFGSPAIKAASVEIHGGIITAISGQNAWSGTQDGISGTFTCDSTKETAIMVTTGIADKTNQDSWSGIIFANNAGKVYKNQTLKTDVTIPNGKTLEIPSGTTLTISSGVILTNNGAIHNYGTITNNGTIGVNPPINIAVVGAFTVTGGAKDTDYSYANNTLTIKSSTALTISTATPTTTDKIVVQSGVTANVTLDSVSITSGACAFEIAGNASCNLTLSGDNTLKSGENKAGLQVSTGATLNINGTGAIDATGGTYSAGIGGGAWNVGGAITINGGTVNATGGVVGAGIGGGNNGAGGTTTINGGTVTATGTDGGAGIGGGNDGAGGTVEINDGTVTATGGSGGAGIGGSLWSPGGITTINGGTVTATGTDGGAGIGGGYGGAGGTTTINGGTVTAIGTDVGAGIGGSKSGAAGTFSTSANGNVFIIASSISHQDNKANWNGVIFEGDAGKVYGTSVTLTTDVTIPNGKALEIPSGTTLTINSGVTLTNNGAIHNYGTIAGSGTIGGIPPINIAVVGAFTVAGGAKDTDYSYANNTLTIKSGTALTISTQTPTTTDKIVVQDGVTANVTLDGVSIDVSATSNACAFEIAGNASCNLTLSGDNTLKSGKNKASLQVQTGATVTIYGTGSLNATGGVQGAGIGGGLWGNEGTVTINGGTVNATGGAIASGIGGGYCGSGGTTIINGGIVNATGESDGAGIGGGGGGGAGGTTQINGGNVTATSGGYGAGIGNSNGGQGGGTFSTGTNGNAFINASSISDKGNQGQWAGIIFEDDRGKVYGNPTLKTDATIPNGKILRIESGTTLTIDHGVTLTNNGAIYNFGTIDGTGTIDGSGTMNVPSSVTVSFTDSTPAYGDEITITATAQKQAGRSASFNTVEFYLGDVHMGPWLGTSAVTTSGNTVTATLTMTTSVWEKGCASWTIGSNTITADFGGSTGLFSSSGTGTLTVSKATQVTPTATIDYLTESLKGLVGSANYSITAGGATSDETAKADGTLAIDSNWFWKTISIIKKGDGTTTADSTAQSLAIPARPTAPTAAMKITKTKDSIAITNTADYTGCEFSSDGSNWNSTGTFSGLTQGTAYTVSVRVKAVANTSFASESKSVVVTTIATDGSTTLKPNESISTGDGKGTITNDDDKTIIDNDKNPSTPNTVITPPSGGDVTVKGDGTVTVPAGGTVTTGNGPIVTLPGGGTVDKDGNVGGDTNGSIIIGDNTITPPTGGTVTTDKDGKTELPGGSTIVNGDTTVKVDDGTSGGSVDKDGNITLPSGGEITVTDKGGNTSTIKVPAAGGEVAVKNDGTVTAPGGSTVTPPGGKPPVTVPEGGGNVGGDGGITSNSTVTTVAVSPATVSIQVGNTQQLTATVTGTNNPVQTVTWTSSNPAAVTVNASGLVTAVASGTAIITAVSTLDTSKSGTVAVTVTSPSSGGSTDDDSDDSSGGTVITPPATQDKPTPPTTVETGVKVKTDKNGNATATVPSKEVTNAIEKAQKEAKKNGTEKNGIAIVLNVNVKENANSLEITLSEASITALRNAKVMQLTINNSLTTMTFDLAALNALQGGDVKLIISEVDVKSLSAESQKAIGNRPVFSFKVRVGGKAVTDFKGGRIGLQMPYTRTTTELAGNLCGVFVDTKGKVTWLENSSYDAITRTSLTSTTHLSVYGVGYKKNVPKFTDTKKHWAKNDIDFVVARGLLTGTGKTNFAPDQSITRGMFVTALGRLAGVNSKKYQSTTFTDVKKDAYYAPYVNWATKKGITSGTTATTFSPEKTVSRQEMAVFMTNYAKATGYTVPKTRSSITFSDNASIASWAKESVKSMQMAGVIMSKDGNRFDPNGIATRAEVSAVLRRYVELVIDRTTAQGFDLNDSGKIVYYEKGKLLPFFFYNL